MAADEPPLSSSRRPHVEIVATAVLQRVITAQYSSGELLPGEHVLAAEFGCARSVVRRALDRLRLAGFVQPLRGRGWAVVRMGDRVPTAQPSSDHLHPVAIVGVYNTARLSIYFEQGMREVFDRLGIPAESMTPQEFDRRGSAAFRGVVALTSSTHLVEMVRAGAELGRPVVGFDHRDLDVAPCDLVHPDNVAYGRLLAGMPAAAGHTPVLIGCDRLPAFAERAAGFAADRMEAGAEPLICNLPHNTVKAESDRIGLIAYWRQRIAGRMPRPALVGACEHLLREVMILLAQLGVRPGVDAHFAVVPHDADPVFTSAPGILAPAPMEPRQQVGRCMALRLMARLWGDTSQAQRYAVAPLRSPQQMPSLAG